MHTKLKHQGFSYGAMQGKRGSAESRDRKCYLWQPMKLLELNAANVKEAKLIERDHEVDRK